MHDVAAMHGAALVLLHPAHCPPWCTDCDHDLNPPCAVPHQKLPAIVAP
jgi:hypothetical protein